MAERPVAEGRPRPGRPGLRVAVPVMALAVVVLLAPAEAAVFTGSGTATVTNCENPAANGTTGVRASVVTRTVADGLSFDVDATILFDSGFIETAGMRVRPLTEFTEAGGFFVGPVAFLLQTAGVFVASGDGAAAGLLSGDESTLSLELAERVRIGERCDISLTLVTTRTTFALAAAALPSSRSLRVNTAGTVLATLENAGAVTAVGCRVLAWDFVPARVTFQALDPATGRMLAAPDAPVDIPAGGRASFVLTITPLLAFGPTDVPLAFICRNTAHAPFLTGVNTLLLSASTSPTPDIVALAASSGAGTLDLAGPGRSGAFAVAAVNVGSAGTLTVTADTGAITLPAAIAVCRTSAATGACLTGAASSASTELAAGGTATFAFFVSATSPVPFDPAANRVFVRFRDTTGVVRGATSVAVRAP